MKYILESAPLCQIKSDALVVGIFQGDEPDQLIKMLDPEFASSSSGFVGNISVAAKEDSFAGKLNQVVLLPTYGQMACKRLVLVGLGKQAEFEPTISRKAAANMARRFALNANLNSICFYWPFQPDGVNDKIDCAKHLQALVEGWILGSFAFQKYKSTKEDKRDPSKVAVFLAGWGSSQSTFDAACQRGEAIANATNLARGLIAEPAAYMTPTRLAEEAKQVCQEAGISCEIFDAGEVEKMGMGAFLGVARGAREAPKFVVMKYEAAQPVKRLAVVGKGITFDSGGLSLKPAQSMEHMKYDMSGAAAVIGTMQVIGSLKPPVSVLGILAATENMPSGSALHPGDIVQAMNGKTIEVNNTDAEGRLVLADALCYACQQGVDEIIDIATLTGAIVTALGRVAAGLMGSDEQLIKNLIAAGREAGEKLWQMPLFDDYKEMLKSDIADLKNAGSRGEAGSSSAAMFLKEFVENKAWAHMDIVGPAWLDKDREECNKGGTAFGVRTICHYILSHKNSVELS